MAMQIRRVEAGEIIWIYQWDRFQTLVRPVIFSGIAVGIAATANLRLALLIALGMCALLFPRSVRDRREAIALIA